jgi:SAM-dependent methyltransferase
MDSSEDSTDRVRCVSDCCRECSVKPFLEFDDATGDREVRSIVRCHQCGTGFTQPPMPDVAALYADRTSRDFQPHTGRLARLIKRIAFRRDARRLVASIGQEPAVAIDFACGSGLFTQCLSEVLPPSTRVVGADFHPNRPRELDTAEYLPFAELEQLAAGADLVLAMHVVEHDDSPAALLRRIARLARPGGHIIVEVPNIDCVWARIFRHGWDAWYLPYHRVHFSRAGLRRLVESCGLAVEREVDVSIPGMGRTLAHILGRRNTLPFILLSAALQPLQWSLERLSGHPSALRFVLRKA